MSCREIAEKIIRKKSFRCTIAGSLRRGEETTHDVDIVCADPDVPRMTERIDRSVRNDCSIDLYRANPVHWGAMMLTYTGPKGSNIGMRLQAKRKGLRLSQYGVFDVGTSELLASETEDEICMKVLNRLCKPPELRGK